MSKTYYHSTSESNMRQILSDGHIRTSIEGIVYCCETAEDCLKFAAIRALSSQISTGVLKIDVPDDIEVEETFDHSEKFFKCRCWGIPCAVPIEWIDQKGSFVINLSGGEKK